MTAGSVLKLLLNIVLIRIPQINICGGAIAETLSDMLIFIYSVRATYRLAGVRCRVTEIYIKPFYSGIMCALTARLVRDILTEQSFFTVNHRIITLSAIAAGCIIYVISLYLLCETPKNLFKYVFSKKNEKST
jgi:stage V sporulation protein B